MQVTNMHDAYGPHVQTTPWCAVGSSFNSSWRRSRTLIPDAVPNCSASLNRHPCCSDNGFCCSSIRAMELHTCDGRVRSITELLPWLHGKKVAILGDSLARWMHWDWAVAFGAHNNMHEITGTSVANVCNYKCATRTCRKEQSCVCTATKTGVRLVWQPNLGLKTVAAFANCSDVLNSSTVVVHGDNVLDLGPLLSALRQAEVVFVNIGVHWNDADHVHYTACLLAVMEHLARAEDEHGAVAIYRETSAQHFSSSDGTGYFSRATHPIRCSPVSDMAISGSRQWRTFAERRAAAQAGLLPCRYAPQFEVFASRDDAVMGTAGVGAWFKDCTHYCQASSVQAGFYDPVVRTLHSALLAKECQRAGPPVHPSHRSSVPEAS